MACAWSWLPRTPDVVYDPRRRERTVGNGHEDAVGVGPALAPDLLLADVVGELSAKGGVGTEFVVGLQYSLG